MFDIQSVISAGFSSNGGVSNIWNIDIARVFMRCVDVDTVMGLEAVMVTTIWSGLE